MEPARRRMLASIAARPVPEGGLPARRALFITVVYFVVQLVVGTAVGVAVGLYYGIGRGALTPGVLAEMERVIVMPAAALSVAAGGAVAFLMARRTLRGPLRDGALRPIGWSPARGNDVVLAASLGVAVAALYSFVLGRLFPPGPGHEWGPVVQAWAAGGWQRILWVVLALCIAPPVEEFLFRGVLWTGLARRVNAALAAVAVTLLFLLVHVMEIRWYWPGWVSISAIGLFAIFLRVRGESLVPPIVLHASYNACLALARLLVAG